MSIKIINPNRPTREGSAIVRVDARGTTYQISPVRSAVVTSNSGVWDSRFHDVNYYHSGVTVASSGSSSPSTVTYTNGFESGLSDFTNISYFSHSGINSPRTGSFLALKTTDFADASMRLTKVIASPSGSLTFYAKAVDTYGRLTVTSNGVNKVVVTGPGYANTLPTAWTRYSVTLSSGNNVIVFNGLGDVEGDDTIALDDITITNVVV